MSGLPEGLSSPWRCLVVDDSELIRRILSDALGHIPGLAVDGASDGQEALDRCAHHTYDLVFTDRDMPRLDGLGFVSELRKVRAYDAVSVVMVSTEADPEAQAEALGVGVSVYLCKPVRAAEIVSLACTLLKIPAGHARALAL